MNDIYDVIINADTIESQVQADVKGYSKEDKENYAERKKAERQALFDKADSTVDMLKNNPAEFQHYLDLQSRLRNHSVNNVLLVYSVNKNAKQVGDYDYWKNKKTPVKRGQAGIPILVAGDEYIKDGGGVGTYYNVKTVFDISQTSARHRVQPKHEDKALIKAMIANGPARVGLVENPDFTDGAQYNPLDNTISLRKGLEAGDIIRSLASEIMHAEMGKHDPAYDRNANSFKAYCGAYMLCKQYHVDTKDFHFASVKEYFADYNAKEMKAELGESRNAANNTSKRIYRNLPNEKSAKQKDER